jgi:predicted O-methyltransferase YrrM
MYPNPNIESIPSAWNIDPQPGHRKYANFLVELIQPQVIVDLGVDYGYSTFSFAEQGIGHVYGIDSFEGDLHAGFRTDTEEFVHKFQRENNIYNVTFIKGYFDQVAKNWLKPIDIIHIDGLHTFEAVSTDYANWAPHVNHNGVILFHDVRSFDEVKLFFNSLELPKLWFEQSAGLGIVSRNWQILCNTAKYFPYVNIGQIP